MTDWGWTDWDPDEPNDLPTEADEVILRTVGIDVGSSTSHLIFSRLVLKRLGLFLSSRYVVVDRQTLYRSRILLTPYRRDTTIDPERLGAFIAAAYAEAGLQPGEIDSGALILTGVAAERDNAAAIGELFSAEAGKLVCAAAGPRLEALLAAHGSGAVAHSRQDGGRRVLNVDVGGGTTKLALIRDGEVLDTAIIGVGARLIARNGGTELARVEHDGRVVADALGIPLELGEALSDSHARRIAEALADAAIEFVSGSVRSDLVRALAQTRPLDVAGVEAVTFSGGLSEYLYGREATDHGDLGLDLTAALRRRIADGALPAPLVEPPEGIRATVIGASQFTVQLSGETITVSDPAALPLRGLPVVYARLPKGAFAASDVREAIGRALERLDLGEGDVVTAVAIEREFEPRYALLRALAEGVVAALPRTVAAGLPIVLVLAGDYGKTVGRIIRHDLGIGTGVVAIDSIHLQELDHIDIGTPVQPHGTVPVVVRSLLFGHHVADFATAQPNPR